jgi:hypothetical protein
MNPPAWVLFSHCKIIYMFRDRVFEIWTEQEAGHEIHSFTFAPWATHMETCRHCTYDGSLCVFLSRDLWYKGT